MNWLLPESVCLNVVVNSVWLKRERGKKGADGVRLKCIDDIVIKHRHFGK